MEVEIVPNDDLVFESADEGIEQMEMDEAQLKAYNKAIWDGIMEHFEAKRPKVNWPFRYPQKGLHY